MCDRNSFCVQGNVEQWLLNLLNGAQGALHAVIRMASVAIKDPVFKLLEFMDTFPAQVLLEKRNDFLYGCECVSTSCGFHPY